MTPLSNFRNLTGLCIPNSPNRSHKCHSKDLDSDRIMALHLEDSYMSKMITQKQKERLKLHRFAPFGIELSTLKTLQVWCRFPHTSRVCHIVQACRRSSGEMSSVHKFVHELTCHRLSEKSRHQPWSYLFMV